MKRALLLILAAASAFPQDGGVERGAQLYRMNCAVPYCHGPDGTAGRAPLLIGHSYSLNGMFKVISWGIPGTGMPEFTSRLKTREIDDLVAFMMTLRGGSAGSAPAPVTQSKTPPRALTADAKAGRALFFDAARMGNCGSCHELDGWGVPVGPDLAVAPVERYADLRAVPALRVATARPEGERPFPALVVERGEARVRVYDLTGPLPVLRSFATSQLTLDANSSWRHEQATHIYTNGELEMIARYLRGRNK